jgi:hypothetical protein
MMTDSELTDQDRADAIALGGAHESALDAVDDAEKWADALAMVPPDDLIAILRDAMQLRRTLADERAQHARDLEALAGDYCPGCGCRVGGHYPVGGCTGVREVEGVWSNCQCTRGRDALQSSRKASPPPIAGADGTGQGGRRKATP